jgi:hypothetical protein
MMDEVNTGLLAGYAKDLGLAAVIRASLFRLSVL